MKSPRYWGPPAHIDKVEYRFIADPTAAFAAMKAGDLDVFPDYPAPENLAQFRSDPRFQVRVNGACRPPRRDP